MVYLQNPPQLLMERKDAPTGPRTYRGEVSASNITSTLNSVLGPRKYDRRLRPNFKRKLTVYFVTPWVLSYPINEIYNMTILSRHVVQIGKYT